MKSSKQKNDAGFSLIEMMAAMVVTLVLLSLVSTMMMSVFGTRRRESQRTDAMTSAKAALNLMSREISNSGYGLTTNGLIAADSDSHKLRFRSNVENDIAILVGYVLDAPFIHPIRWPKENSTLLPSGSGRPQ